VPPVGIIRRPPETGFRINAIFLKLLFSKQISQ
jgi:hypothetical protein